MAKLHHRQCTICSGDFKQPKFLDCFHTFCLECLRGLENKTPGSINCPLCQRNIQLPEGGVDKLTTNGYIEDRQAEVVQKVSETVAVGPNVQQNNSRRQQLDEKETILVKYSSKDRQDGQGRMVKRLSCHGLEFEVYFPRVQKCMVLLFMLSDTNNFIHSCNIEYDITFINQKNAEFSINETGSGVAQSSQGYPYKNIPVKVYLIRKQDAISDRNGFLVKKSEDNKDFTFKLNFGMKVSNIEKVNFKLNKQ